LVLIVCVMAAGCAAPRDAALEPVLEPELTAAVEPALEPSPYIEMVEEQPRLRGQSGGVITGSRGEPVVGAQIRLWVDADGDGAIGPGDSIWAITESTGAGADEAPGSYVFTDLGPGCYITECVGQKNLVTTVAAWCSPEAATAPWAVTVDSVMAAACGPALEMKIGEEQPTLSALHPEPRRTQALPPPKAEEQLPLPTRQPEPKRTEGWSSSMGEDQPPLPGQSGGVITGSRGEPVVGAQIRLWVDVDGDGAIGPGDSIWAITESAGAGGNETPGSYVFADLGPGCYITEYVNPRTLVTTVKAWCSPEAATAPWSVTVDFGG